MAAAVTMKVMMTINPKSDDYEGKFPGEDKKQTPSANLCLVKNTANFLDIIYCFVTNVGWFKLIKLGFYFFCQITEQ